MKKITKLFALFLALAVCLGAATAVFAEGTGFSDVETDDYFYPAVKWGVEAGITYGVGGNRFGTRESVTRAQVVTFLWRMAGQPAPETAEAFTDVEAGSWYETAVQWAVGSGITLGTGEGKFSPETVCDRAMCITLLYRLNKSPLDGIDFSSPVELNEESTFEDFGAVLIKSFVEAVHEYGALFDVPEGSYYELPVLWACLNGIINEDNTGSLEAGVLFRPADACLRDEMISFLYQTKLVEDSANAPMTYEIGGLTLPFPQEYEGRLAYDVYGVSEDDEDEPVDEETVIVVSELASREAAEALGEEYTEGAGELFRINRVSEKRLHELLCGDMSGINAFFKDESGKYYLVCYPTDVRYFRENTDKMYEDAEQWTELTGWAADIPEAILEFSSGITQVSYSNTMLDMYLARIAYAKDVEYTLSTTEFGPLKPGKVDGTKYAEYLLEGNFTMLEDEEAPDGEYVVLNFPEDGVRYDFFTADQNLVREVRDGYETLYRRVLPGRIANTEAMLGWYMTVAEQAGKKEDYKELDPFIGTWREEHAGRGTMTVTKSVGLAKVDISASWPGSAFETATWDITASLANDGRLVYYDGRQVVTRYDEDGKATPVSEINDAKGIISLSGDKLIWDRGDEGEDTFVRAD